LQGYALQLRNEQTMKMSFENLVGALEGDGLKKEFLQAHYRAFEEEYWDLVMTGLCDPTESLPYWSERALTIPHLEGYSNQEKCRHIVAYVCAYWTVQHTVSSGENVLDNDEMSLRLNLLQPHAAQIIAIFRMLGICDDGCVGAVLLPSQVKTGGSESQMLVGTLTKQLVEVLTGEGKSLVLAITSIVLAIMGCSASCACYRSVSYLCSFVS
jgi:hypothetical protein